MQVISLLCVRFRLQQAASVDAGEHNVVNISSLRSTAGSVTPCHKRTLIIGNDSLFWYIISKTIVLSWRCWNYDSVVHKDVGLLSFWLHWLIKISLFSHLSIHSFIWTVHCTCLASQASLLSWHQDQVVQRADPPCGRERRHPPAGSVLGQRQDQDVTRAKQNHPAQAEEQRRELAQSKRLFAEPRPPKYCFYARQGFHSPVAHVQFAMGTVANSQNLCSFGVIDYTQEQMKAAFSGLRIVKWHLRFQIPSAVASEDKLMLVLKLCDLGEKCLQLSFKRFHIVSF